MPKVASRLALFLSIVTNNMPTCMNDKLLPAMINAFIVFVFGHTSLCRVSYPSDATMNMIITIITPKNMYIPVGSAGESGSMISSLNTMITIIVNEDEIKYAIPADSLCSVLIAQTSIMIITNMATNVLTMMMYVYLYSIVFDVVS
jgi:hypothetical protein